MSQSTKRKHVAKEVLNEFEIPKDNQKIVRLVGGRGNNLHQVIEADESTTYLVSMPTKYRKSVWIKRGDYCVVEAIEEGDKVKAEIVRILYKEQIRYIKSENSWPFKDNTMSEDTNERGDNDDSSDNDDDLFQNTNHQSAIEHSESSEDEDSDAK